MIRLLTWGPRNGPQTPNARRASAKPRRASIIVAGVEPRNGPKPPTLVAPRRTRGAPRSTPDARRAPGEPGARLDQPPTLVAPRETRGAPRCGRSIRCGPAAPGRASVLLAHVERLDRLDVGGVQQCERAGPAVGRGL